MNNMHGFAKICMLIIGMVFFNGIALDYSVSGVDSCVKGLKTNHLWLEMVNVHKKPSARDLDGNQILHLRSKNKNPITADRSGKTASYILQHLKEAAVFYSDADILKFAVEKAASLKGEYFEFGVGVGKTTNFIAALIPFKTLHGFDSFCGLPETWFSTCPQGEIGFKIQGAMPPLHANVLVHVGLFENVLPLFKKQYLKSQPVAFIHIDCDLYSSTKFVLDCLTENIQPGTIIIFDEYFGYSGWQDHEFKAFQEFIIAKKLSYKYLAYNAFHEQVVVQIL